MKAPPTKEQFPYRTAKGRLAFYRAYAAWLTEGEHNVIPQRWKYVRHYRPYVRTNAGVWSGDREKFYIDNWPKGWRDLGDCDVALRRANRGYRGLDHTGWFADNDNRDLVKGRVLQLPARKGSTQYIAGTYRTECDGATLYPDRIFDDIKDCAMYADERACREAENAREEDAKYAAEQQIEEKREEIKAARTLCLELLREMRNGSRLDEYNSPRIWQELVDRVGSYRRSIKEARERIAELEDNFWLSVEGS